jgi:formate dehydrogenase assembly factor FdhD
MGAPDAAAPPPKPPGSIGWLASRTAVVVLEGIPRLRVQARQMVEKLEKYTTKRRKQQARMKCGACGEEGLINNNNEMKKHSRGNQVRFLLSFGDRLQHCRQWLVLLLLQLHEL